MEDGRRSNTGSPAGAVHAATGTPRGAGWAGRVAERPVILKTWDNARRGKGPQVWRDDGGAKACGSGSAYEPRVKVRRVAKHHMRKRRGRAEWAWYRRGVNRPGGATAGDTARVKPCSLWQPGARKSVGTVSVTRTGVPRARGMIPLESRMREIRTSGSEGRGGNGPMGAGLSTAAKASGFQAPDPTGTAPPPDPTCAVERRAFLVGANPTQ